MSKREGPSVVHYEIKKKLQVQFIKCYLFNDFCIESGTLKIYTINKLGAYKMWICCRVLKMSWTTRMANEEVVKRMNKDQECMVTTKCK